MRKRKSTRLQERLIKEAAYIRPPAESQIKRFPARRALSGLFFDAVDKVLDF